MTLQEQYEKETGKLIYVYDNYECLGVSFDYAKWLENKNKSIQESIDKMQKALGGVV